LELDDDDLYGHSYLGGVASVYYCMTLNYYPEEVTPSKPTTTTTATTFWGKKFFAPPNDSDSPISSSSLHHATPLAFSVDDDSQLPSTNGVDGASNKGQRKQFRRNTRMLVVDRRKGRQQQHDVAPPMGSPSAPVKARVPTTNSKPSSTHQLGDASSPSVPTTPTRATMMEEEQPPAAHAVRNSCHGLAREPFWTWRMLS
jgi:hypothetical protein